MTAGFVCAGSLEAQRTCDVVDDFGVHRITDFGRDLAGDFTGDLRCDVSIDGLAHGIRRRCRHVGCNICRYICIAAEAIGAIERCRSRVSD